MMSAIIAIRKVFYTPLHLFQNPGCELSTDELCAFLDTWARSLNSIRLPRNRIRQLLGVVQQKALKTIHDVRLSNVDVVTLGYTGRAVAHKASEGELVHAAFRTPSSEGMTPAVELEGLQSSIPDSLFVNVLNGGQMPRFTGTWENVF
jgi:hypothetical protein